jgi:hypothetical protein
MFAPPAIRPLPCIIGLRARALGSRSNPFFHRVPLVISPRLTRTAVVGASSDRAHRPSFVRWIVQGGRDLPRRDPGARTRPVMGSEIRPPPIRMNGQLDQEDSDASHRRDAMIATRKAPLPLAPPIETSPPTRSSSVETVQPLPCSVPKFVHVPLYRRMVTVPLQSVHEPTKSQLGARSLVEQHAASGNDARPPLRLRTCSLARKGTTAQQDPLNNTVKLVS